jgi:hypothetical protein
MKRKKRRESPRSRLWTLNLIRTTAFSMRTTRRKMTRISNWLRAPKSSNSLTLSISKKTPKRRKT